ncbi:hypothetical protein ACQ4PT_014939 [Festuca glaucescens]
MESLPSSSPLPCVCVTGGGGFIASWLVKLLLSRGYAVNATVRDPCDPKNAFLKQLDGAPENLRLFTANMLDYDTLMAPFARCEGVFHVASPVPEGRLVDPEASVSSILLLGLGLKEMMTPAIEGTRNVLKACSATNVQKFIQVSSVLAAVYNPGWPQGEVRDESSWSDKEFCRENEAGSSERYLCSLDLLDMKDLLEILKNMYPNYSYADKLVDADYRIEITSHRLKNLGWKPRKLEETLADSVESYEEAGFLQVLGPCRLPFLFLVPTVQE